MVMQQIFSKSFCGAQAMSSLRLQTQALAKSTRRIR